MRDFAPVLGVMLGLVVIAADIRWPYSPLLWMGFSCVIASLLAGAALHPLSAFERARLERSLALNARSQAEDGYWRTIRRLAWELVRRLWIFYAFGILVSVFVFRRPAQYAWAGWSIGALALLLGTLLVATLNHIFMARRARLRATGGREIVSADPSRSALD